MVTILLPAVNIMGLHSGATIDLFNSKYGKNISVYLRYNIGSKKVMRSIFTSEDINEINNIVEEIKKKQ